MIAKEMKAVWVSYPEEAKGWNQGVYTERKMEWKPLKNCNEEFSKHLKAESETGYFSIPNKMWTETEHTGFGIYPYVEGIGFWFESRWEDVCIEATLCNPTEESISVQAFVDGILLLKEALVEPKQTLSISIPYCSAEKESLLQFFVPTTETQKENVKENHIYLKELDYTFSEKKEAREKTTIYLASDSTVQTYEEFYYPQTGWGQVFHRFVKTKLDSSDVLSTDLVYPQCHTYEHGVLTIENRSIGARSARSFIQEGKWHQLLLRAHPGDICLLQWAHNDATAVRPNRYVAPEDFGTYLGKYIYSCQKRGIYPVLVTPVSRRNCDDHEGKFVRSFEAYREVMLQTGKKHGIFVVDLGKRSCDYLNQIGPEESKLLYLWANPSDYPDGAYADGVSDNTHLQEYGASIYARMVWEEILKAEGYPYLDALKDKIDLSIELQKPKKSKSAVVVDPEVPTGFALQELHIENKIANFLLIWNDVEGAVTYQVYRKGSVDFQFFPLKSVSALEKKTSAVLPFSLPAADVYRVQVTAIFADGRESKPSKTIEFRA